MIQFDHTITEPECDAQYLNLTDAHGRKYGKQVGPANTVVTVLDATGREYAMKRHGGNQLTRCTEWFRDNGITPGALIRVRFDPQQGHLHLERFQGDAAGDPR